MYHLLNINTSSMSILWRYCNLNLNIFFNINIFAHPWPVASTDLPLVFSLCLFSYRCSANVTMLFDTAKLWVTFIWVSEIDLPGSLGWAGLGNFFTTLAMQGNCTSCSSFHSTRWCLCEEWERKKNTNITLWREKVPIDGIFSTQCPLLELIDNLLFELVFCNYY